MDFENVLISIPHKWGDIDFNLQEWMNPGLEESHRQQPYRIRDKASGMELSFSIIPMSYRLDNISRFYINSGICLPPWGTSGHRIEFNGIQSPERKQLIEKGIKYNIQLGNYTLGFSEKFCSLLNKQFPSTVEMYLCDSCIYVDETNPDELSNLVSSSKTIIFLLRREFTGLKQAVNSYDEHYWINQLESIIPDKDMGNEIVRQYNPEFACRCYAIHNLHNKQMTVMSGIWDLPESEETIPDMDIAIIHRTQLTIIALTRGIDRQDALLSLINSLIIERRVNSE